MNKKNKIVTILSVLFIVAVSYIYISSKKTRTELPKEKFAQNLNISKHLSGSDIKIEIKDLSKTFKFAKELPYLNQQVDQKINLTYLESVTKKLGFNSSYIEINDILDGKSYVWNDEEYSIIATPKTNNISVSSNSPVTSIVKNVNDLKLNEDDYKKIAEEYLNKFEIDTNALSFQKIAYFYTKGSNENLTETDKDNYEIAQLSYAKSLKNYQIITNNPNESDINIKILKNGKILSANMFLGYKYEPSENLYPVKNYDQLVNSLTESLPILLDDGGINILDLNKNNFRSIVIEKISISYLKDNSPQLKLQPVFILYGKAYLKDTVSDSADIVLYNPAFLGFQ